MAKSDVSTTNWLPLWMHLEDTAGIMKKLFDDFVAKSFADSCGVDSENLRKTAVFLAYVHDIGKATVGFQYKIGCVLADRVRVLEKYGLKIPELLDKEYVKHSPHNLAGEEILLYLGVNEGVASIVGAHHGIPSISGDITDQNLEQECREVVGYDNYFGKKGEDKEIIESVWRKIIDRALEYSKLGSVDELPELSEHAQMLITGLLVISDWISSNTMYFSLISIDEDKPECNPYPNRVDKAWKEIDFPSMWQPQTELYSNTYFREMFGFIPSEIQRKVLEIVQKAKSSGIYILEAPMGCGKTEAALSSAEILASKFGRNGLFFGLPTQATVNGLFPRVQSWAENQSLDDYHSIQLKHGSSQLNKAFAAIQKGIPEQESDSGLVNHAWFCESKKACLADFVIATVDRMLMMALKRKHLMLLHFGLAEKVVVIDEVHAYDAYMNMYLERALSWLGKYHTPVILLSATLPAKRRMSLVQAYLSSKKTDESIEKNLSYPLLTWTDGKMVNQESLPYTGAHKTVNVKKCMESDLSVLVDAAVKKSGCVGIIVNTVKRAQNIADILRLSDNAEVILYHAQYVFTDRSKKEEELLERIGKGSNPEIRKGLVVVGTQVLEQSLDIDFDLLITDICPMDLLLQRIGRLHRHSRSDRPQALSEAVCYVLTDEYDNEKTGSRNIYGDWLLNETFEKLPEKIVLPDDISTLVQDVYGDFDESDEYQKYIDEQKKSENRAESFLLDIPDDSIDGTIHGMLARDVSDNDKCAEASVRDGMLSIEVLVMQKLADNTIQFIDGTPLSPEMTDEECLSIAEQKLRLPSIFCQQWAIDRTIREIEKKSLNYIAKWQEKYMLKGELVLFLDENFECKIGEYQLNYSYENGLQYKKESDVNDGNQA